MATNPFIGRKLIAEDFRMPPAEPDRQSCARTAGPTRGLLPNDQLRQWASTLMSDQESKPPPPVRLRWVRSYSDRPRFRTLGTRPHGRMAPRRAGVLTPTGWLKRR